ncbi:CGNR zinc finger domain-containing protein [Pseudoduganella plicata]|uniref:CGNR zinc finger domain-containing protein n=1 Tax=Pseudoduganella plicata TaxID=321984 RepID=UPI001E31EEB3|nr:ABATE domain-containing protein [Pseudoduganella plicata]
MAPIVGDHLALDLLNTQARNDGATVDYWNSGDDVLDWLARHDIAPKTGAIDRNALLTRAKALRALAHRLIVQRKENTMGDIDGLNEYLHACLSAPHLERDGAGNLVLTRTQRGTTLAALLGPVAEAVAGLLAEGDFALVRQCEHPDCVLWFYDRTKAHKRRWCSMALCGNRYKAAQFRKRSSS